MEVILKLGPPTFWKRFPISSIMPTVNLALCLEPPTDPSHVCQGTETSDRDVYQVQAAAELHSPAGLPAREATLLSSATGREKKTDVKPSDHQITPPSPLPHPNSTTSTTSTSSSNHVKSDSLPLKSFPLSSSHSPHPSHSR